MTAMSVVLLAFYLTCVIYGVITLCLYENTSGLGLMAVGVLLYFGAELALTESWTVRNSCAFRHKPVQKRMVTSEQALKPQG